LWALAHTPKESVELTLMSSRTERTHDDAMRTQRRTTMTQAKRIPGYQIHPKLPTGIYLDATAEDANFITHDGQACVEVHVSIGLSKTRCAIVMKLQDAQDASIIVKA